MRNRARIWLRFLGSVLLLALATVYGACGTDSAPPVGGTVVFGSTTTVSASTASAGCETTNATASVPSTTAPTPVVITILYDNTGARPGTRGHWGFSCLIEGLEKTVLFDTGANGDILLANMEVLGVKPQQIEVVVLSHDHRDHTGGLASIVGRNPDITLYYPESFSPKTLASARQAGARLVPVAAAVSPCPGLTVTAPSGSPGESALLIHAAKGEVVVVGCAHPGVLEMAAAARQLAERSILAVMGGFHLSSRSAEQVENIIRGLREMGIERCGPAHCTGEAAIAQMKAAFHEGFIEMGVGSSITF